MRALRVWGALAAVAAIPFAAGCDDDDAGENEAPPAESAPAPTGAGGPEPSNPGMSPARAQRKLAAALPEIPAWLPAPLPADTTIESLDVRSEDGEPYAQVQLDLGKRGPLQLQYGRARFDGCPADVRPATVAGQDALLARATPPGKLTTVIWPVRDTADPASAGIYGVGGELPPGQILELAASMSRYAIPAPSDSGPGC